MTFCQIQMFTYQKKDMETEGKRKSGSNYEDSKWPNVIFEFFSFGRLIFLSFYLLLFFLWLGFSFVLYLKSQIIINNEISSHS
jgi:hypothetical protein